MTSHVAPDLDVTAERPLAGGGLERDVAVGDVPGIVWTPPLASAATPVPLVLLGHPPLGLGAMRARLAARAAQAVADGFAAATVELPGSGERPRLDDLESARATLRRALQAGEPVTEDLKRALILPLVDRAVPEWRTALDAVLTLPEVRGPVAYTGGVTAIGVRLAAIEPRVVAAVLFAGSLLPRAVVEEARSVTVPVHVLLQWDDEGNDRQDALELFDALGSRDKTLLASTGGHTGVPESAGEAAARFLARHLR